MELVGVVKSKAAKAVVRNETTMRNAREFYNYCQNNLTDVGHSSSFALHDKAGVCSSMSWQRLNPPLPDLLLEPSTNPQQQGTRALHAIKPTGVPEHVFVKNYPCMCDPCANNEGECQHPFLPIWWSVSLVNDPHAPEGPLPLQCTPQHCQSRTTSATCVSLDCQCLRDTIWSWPTNNREVLC